MCRAYMITSALADVPDSGVAKVAIVFDGSLERLGDPRSAILLGVDGSILTKFDFSISEIEWYERHGLWLRLDDG